MVEVQEGENLATLRYRSSTGCEKRQCEIFAFLSGRISKKKVFANFKSIWL